jgi:nucleotide-binding universal stress UspA family protein
MFTHLLVPLDGSPLAACVLPHAVAFARAFQSKVTLLRVLAAPSSGAPINTFDWQLQKAEAEAYLDSIAQHLQTAEVPTEAVLVEGQPANQVIDYVHRNQIDLVILSSHGESGLTGWNIGSVAQKILLRSQVSSLLVRAYQPLQTERTDLRYQRLLVPLDGSVRAECALPVATILAQFYDAELWLAHVVRQPDLPHYLPFSPEERALIEQLLLRNQTAVAQHLEQLRAHWPSVTEIRLLTDAAVAATLDALTASEQLDLVVLSAHGYSGGSQWPYGSVTTNFIVYGQAPLLLVQDLPVERPPTVGEVAAQAAGGHAYRVMEHMPAH